MMEVTISRGKDSEGDFWTVSLETEDRCHTHGKYRDRFEAWDIAKDLERNQ